MNDSEKFELIKDILYFSFELTRDNPNKKYFSNVNSDNVDSMGNIGEIYNLLYTVL